MTRCAINWAFTWTGDPGTTCDATGTGTLTPGLRCTDDAIGRRDPDRE